MRRKKAPTFGKFRGTSRTSEILELQKGHSAASGRAEGEFSE